MYTIQQINSKFFLTSPDATLLEVVIMISKVVAIYAVPILAIAFVVSTIIFIPIPLSTFTDLHTKIL